MGEVHALVIECGRCGSDDLPAAASGATILCYAPGTDLEEAIEAACAVVRAAGMVPFVAAAHGGLAERRARGELTASERLLIDRALRTRRVIIAELTPVFGRA